MDTANIVQTDKFSLSSYDFKSLAIGLGITLAGAALTYISEALVHINMGVYGPIIMAFWAFFVNLARKYISESKYIK